MFSYVTKQLFILAFLPLLARQNISFLSEVKKQETHWF